MPKVSVVIPTFNRGQLVEQAVRSVLRQSFGDFEVVVVDDGSTDDTRERLSRLDDRRVSYHYQTNAGRSAARNRGVAVARGEYVGFLDSDDALLPDALDREVPVLERDAGLALVAGGVRFVDGRGRVRKEWRPWLELPAVDVEALLLGCPMIPDSVLVRRDWVEKIGGFDGRVETAEDWDLWIRLAHAGCRMAWVEGIVCEYRVHGGNSVLEGSRHKQSTIAVLDKFFADPGRSEAFSALRDLAYSRVYLRGACREYAVGQVEEARRDLDRALRLGPELAQHGGKLLLRWLVGSAGDPLVGGPVEYVERVWANLPESAPALGGYRSKAVALAAMNTFYRAYGNRDWPTVRWSFPRACAFDRSWLLNRGAVVTWMESIVGTRCVEGMRGLARRMRVGERSAL